MLPRRGRRRRQFSLLHGLLLVSFGLAAAGASLAQGQSAGAPEIRDVETAAVAGTRALLMTIPGANWAELRAANMPHLHRLMERGAVGLMPVADPSGADPNRIWVTLGAGRSAVDVAGLMGVGAGGEMVVEVEALRVANREAHTGARIGLLGELLRGAGVGAAVVGEGGTGPAAEKCLGAVVLADGEGRVEWVETPEQSSAEGIGAALSGALRGHRVVLIDLCHAAMAEEAAQTAPGGELPREQAEALARADEIIGEAVAALEPYEGMLMVVSPVSPNYPDPRVRSLGPAVVYENGQRNSPGLLTSGSTRWPGLVAAVDVAPTVLGWLGVSEGPGFGEMNGRRMTSLPAPEAMRVVSELDGALTSRYRLRFAAVKWYVACGLAMVVVGLGLVLVRPGGLRFVGGAGLAFALVPVGLLLSPTFGLEPEWRHLAVAGAISVAGGILAARCRRAAWALGASMVVGSALIAGDVVFGSWLMRRSALGFTVMWGSRFYGIGNEYMGVLAAMTALGLGALVQVAPRAGGLAGALGAAVVLAVGAPAWGANWGGSFAVAAGLVALWTLYSRRSYPRAALEAAALLAASVIAPAGLDLLRPVGERSHIGLGAAALLTGQGGVLVDTVARKLAMNWSILAAGRWGVILLALVVVLLWKLLGRGGPARRALAGQRGMRAGIAGALIAGVAALVVNDSGILAWATSLGVVAGAAMFLSARGAVSVT